MFKVDDVELSTSTYSQTDWTQNCVGVGTNCQCHIRMGDSVTRQFTLAFPNQEFASFLNIVR